MDVAGKLVPCEVSLVPLPDRRRTLIRASIFDITERKRAQETRARLEEELRQAQKMEAVGRLAGGVAHDFNNLLTVIGGRMALMAEKLHSEDPVRRDVELVQRATERAAALTRQLLAFSRKQLLQPKVLDLNTVVSALEHMLRRLIGEDIDVVTALAPDIGLIRADPAQIDQVIMNLAVNARDAMVDGGRLTLSTARVDVDAGATSRQEVAPAGAYVVLRVADTGIGMDSATMERIFEPFFTTKEVGKGTGLGLSTVYGIVTQSGGFIGVDSTPGRGTVFTIHLPLVQGEEGHATSRARAGDGPHGRETVLLVEDEPAVRALTRDILHIHGYRVLETAGPAEAEQMCRDHAGPIHALLTDVVMPQMSGRALAARLSPMRPAMRVLYMTGYDDAILVGHGGPGSGPALLTKPFTPAELAAKLRSVLD
jgi:signal transduction histidine kinase